MGRPATEVEIDREHAEDESAVAEDYADKASEAEGRDDLIAAEKLHAEAAKAHRSAAVRHRDVGNHKRADTHARFSKIEEQQAQKCRALQTGKRGGRFYLTATGQKVYTKG